MLVVFTSWNFSWGQEWIFYLDSCENYVKEGSHSIKRIVTNYPEKKFVFLFTDYYKNGGVLTNGIAKSRNGKTKDGNFTFLHPNGNKMASGQISKDIKGGQWKYFDPSGSEIQKESLVSKLPTITFTIDGTTYKGKCFCYNKEGIWQETNLTTNKTKLRHYEEGQQIAEDGIYLIKDDTAKYRFGMKEFYKYTTEQLKYPFITRLTGKHGTVFVQFTIDTMGNLIDPTFLTSLDGPTERKIKKVLLSTSGNWTPAKYKGNKVSTKLILPVIFEFK